MIFILLMAGSHDEEKKVSKHGKKRRKAKKDTH